MEIKCSDTSHSTCASAGTKDSVSAYKSAYNRHRRKPNDPLYMGDLDELVDFSTKFDSDPRVVKLINPNDRNERDCDNERCVEDNQRVNDHATLIHRGPLFGIKSHPGFVYAPQALGPSIQNLVAFKALTEFCEAPHMTNIDLVPRKEDLEIDNGAEDHYFNGNLTMWNLWKRDLKHVSGRIDEKLVEKKCDTLLSKNLRKKKDGTIGKKKPKLSEKLRYYRSFGKLSWATMGYHYDWTARTYIEEKKSTMPLLLDILGSSFALLDQTLTSNSTKEYPSETPDGYSFTSSATIVNYYSTKSNMGGHCDDLEYDFTKPVVSINLGLPAIFLLGRKRKDDEVVVPILVRPGDVMLLGGESRLCFHGMARVIPNEVRLPPVKRSITMKEQDKIQIQSLLSILNARNGDVALEANYKISTLDSIPLDKFLSEHRINVNIRQVLPDGVDTIPDERI